MKFFTILIAATSVVLAQEAAPTGTACVAHEDHWDCPSGVPEPTTPPPAVAQTTGSVTATTTDSDSDHDHDHDDETATNATACHAHGDHWHCPSGVPEPTTPPPSSLATTTAASTTGSQGGSSAASSPAAQSPGAGVANHATGGLAMAAVGAVGWLFV